MHPYYTQALCNKHACKQWQPGSAGGEDRANRVTATAKILAEYLQVCISVYICLCEYVAKPLITVTVLRQSAASESEKKLTMAILLFLGQACER